MDFFFLGFLSQGFCPTFGPEVFGARGQLECASPLKTGLSQGAPRGAYRVINSPSLYRLSYRGRREAANYMRGIVTAEPW
jgi:hypothetical protein